MVRLVPEVGDVVVVKSFAYTNEYGGTELERREIKVLLTKNWYDEETGERYHAVAIDEPALEGKTIYVGQFDVVSVEKPTRVHPKLARGKSKKKPGWHKEKYRHHLASKGVRTRRVK